MLKNTQTKSVSAFKPANAQNGKHPLTQEKILQNLREILAYIGAELKKLNLTLKTLEIWESDNAAAIAQN